MTDAAQGDLFAPRAKAAPRFNGSDYVPQRDNVRLTGQIERVWQFMNDGKFHTLPEIAEGTGDPPASISAQLRHLRKPRFGAHRVEKYHDPSGGLFHYRLVPSEAGLLLEHAS